MKWSTDSFVCLFFHQTLFHHLPRYLFLSNPFQCSIFFKPSFPCRDSYFDGVIRMHTASRSHHDWAARGLVSMVISPCIGGNHAVSVKVSSGGGLQTRSHSISLDLKGLRPNKIVFKKNKKIKVITMTFAVIIIIIIT